MITALIFVAINDSDDSDDYKDWKKSQKKD